ncbi:MAG: phytanoyl-CoA dioxygenase family protein [Spirochaetia bacterium]|nr:phytanoyl-CoA dioxygenase family protein [Spirochaetia bacterium]
MSVMEKVQENKVLLSEVEIASFLDQGFLVKEKIVSPATIELLKKDVEKIAVGGYPSKTFKALVQEKGKSVFESILCIHQPHTISPVITDYVKHPVIADILSKITAAHLPWWDGSVKCMQSMFFVKPPTFPGQAWHQDEIYIPTRDRSLIGAWTAIDDATVENGCLYVIPGSHKPGYLYPQRPHNNPEEFDASAESYGFDDSAEIAVEVPSGSVVFFNGYLLHRSRKNRSQVYRRALVNHYMNAYSLLPWGLEKDPVNVAQKDNRQVIAISGKDPYEWKGYQPGVDAHLRSLGK